MAVDGQFTFGHVRFDPRTLPRHDHPRLPVWVFRYRSLGAENRFMSAMPRKRRLAVKASSVAMGQFRKSRHLHDNSKNAVAT